ncbi:hypothetical protein DFH07DRAFT_766616 [Mycena maculata]|uniref:Uncharacterized protein n=1 Tax=Mycena maculata TaxID=230809 RepID=A0AAD7NVR0_9AGAR|nr:hypothetical protein DFH07DRAFT_766616 [Mycena maculata]
MYSWANYPRLSLVFQANQITLITVSLAAYSPAPTVALVLPQETLNQGQQQENGVQFFLNDIATSVIRWNGDYCIDWVQDPTPNAAEGLEGCALLYLYGVRRGVAARANQGRGAVGPAGAGVVDEGVLERPVLRIVVEERIEASQKSETTSRKYRRQDISFVDEGL